MKLRLRAKLTLLAFLLIGLAISVAFLFMRREVRGVLVDHITGDLLTRAALVSAWASGSNLGPADIQGWDRLADDLSARAKARITFIAPGGQVLGDSELSVSEVSGLRSHADRPEFRAVREVGSGVSERFSVTLNKNQLYVAVPVFAGASTFPQENMAGSRESAGELIAVARLAMQLEEVETALGSLEKGLFLASVIGLFIAVLVASFAAKTLAHTATHLTEVARRMAEGDLSVRARIPYDDELGPLGAGLDLLATNLSSTLAELTTERDKMSSMLESMQEGVMLLDLDGSIRHVNPALREMLLVSSEVIGRTLLETVRQSELHALLERARRSKKPCSAEIELRGLKPRVLMAQVLPVKEQGWLVVFLDVTEMRRLEGMRRDFVANVSHELRTPVASIYSAVETLMGGAKDEPKAASRFLDMIGRNAVRLRDLVENLLSLSSIESGAFHFRKETLAVDEVVQQAVRMFEGRARVKRQEILVNIPKDLPTIHADARAMEHILSNLLDNALKYTSEGDAIRIVLSLTGNTIEFSVADSGPGIAKEHLNRLFERFYRVDKGRSRDLGGTGLGLSIVKNLVEAHGGTVGVESVPGEGARFWVRLPISRQPSSATSSVLPV